MRFLNNCLYSMWQQQQFRTQPTVATWFVNFQNVRNWIEIKSRRVLLKGFRFVLNFKLEATKNM